MKKSFNCKKLIMIHDSSMVYTLNNIKDIALLLATLNIVMYPLKYEIKL